MDKIRVLHVDDSTVIRGIIKSILSSEPDIELLESARNGEIGVEAYKAENPDVVVMDIEMPVMDGITALEKIKEYDRNAKVIMCSTLTVDNAEITMRAMKMGAVDYIAKPTSVGEVGGSEEFKKRLIRLVKLFRKGRHAPKNATTEPKKIVGGMEVTEKIELRQSPPLHWKPKIVAVGSSTGGPQALFEFMKELKGVDLPVVITQHMPPTFTNLLAKHISDNTGFDCVEALQGMRVEKGKAIIAQGGRHMEFVQDTSGNVMVELTDGPSINFCKPAVDPMLESLNELYEGQILSVILTGMGSDGAEGVKKSVESGGYCVAQNQDTSVVWGMPGAVATQGLCSAVLPLGDIAKWVKEKIG
jgi:two-component system chemotaxis response regulator CheB